MSTQLTVMSCILVTLLVAGFSVCLGLNSSYPLEASWFQPRFTKHEWDDVLDQYKAIGGQRIMLKGETLKIRERDELEADPTFAMCKNTSTNASCVSETERDLGKLGLKIFGWMSYDYYENFDPVNVMACPELTDKRYTAANGRVYFRLVISMSDMDDECKTSFKPGTSVVVILTSFGGVDPQELLLESAKERNLYAYFGFPGIPSLPHDMTNATALNFTNAYLYFSLLVLTNHRFKYGPDGQLASSDIKKSRLPIYMRSRIMSGDESCDDTRRLLRDKQLYKSFHNMTPPFVGYYVTDEVPLTKLQHDIATDLHVISWTCFYAKLNELLKLEWFSAGLVLGIVFAPTIDLRRQSSLSSVSDHVAGFEFLLNNSVSVWGPDVVAVHTGTGSGKAADYWSFQRDESIYQVDPALSKVLKVDSHVTYGDYYTASTRELFAELSKSQAKRETFCLMPAVDSFLQLTSAPCVENATPDTDVVYNRISLSRLNSEISAVGYGPQLIASSFWDPYFRCTNGGYPRSLATEISNSLQTYGIISHCEFPSPTNSSVVLYGYNLVGSQFKFQINWRDAGGAAHNTTLAVVSADAKYGYAHYLVQTLQSVLLDKFPYVAHVQPGSFLTVSAGGDTKCVFGVLGKF